MGSSRRVQQGEPQEIFPLLTCCWIMQQGQEQAAVGSPHSLPQEHRVKPELPHSHICGGDAPSFASETQLGEIFFPVQQVQPLCYFHVKFLSQFCEDINI